MNLILAYSTVEIPEDWKYILAMGPNDKRIVYIAKLWVSNMLSPRNLFKGVVKNTFGFYNQIYKQVPDKPTP